MEGPGDTPNQGPEGDVQGILRATKDIAHRQLLRLDLECLGKQREALLP